MESYLIEFRFQSNKAKKDLKNIMHIVTQKCGVDNRKHIPHITVCGSITTNNERRLISDFERLCSQTKLPKFKGNEFGTFDSNKVLYVKINPNERFEEFRIKLVETIKPYCQLQKHDHRLDRDKFGWHCTLLMHLDDSVFKNIKKQINKIECPDIGQIVMRLTLLKGREILREYDFLQRRLLTRREALSDYVLRESNDLLREFMAGQYDPNEDVVSAVENERSSLLIKIKSFFGLK